jgi:hypothetical protein
VSADTSDDTGLDFDLSFGEDDASSSIEESSFDMEMDTSTDTEIEVAADNSIDMDMGGLDFETADSGADDEPLEFSIDSAD